MTALRVDVDELGPWRCSCGPTFEPIQPPPWLPWAVAVLALFVTALAVWVST